MPVFISYSHENAELVERIASQLVNENVHVWFDKWELRPGDSLIKKIQDAIGDADCLCVVLSQASVKSAWFEKELNAGLIRELEERRVIVLPVLIEDCEIPMFLREKVYADFRSDYETGFESLVEALAPVINANAGRVEAADYITDFAWDYGEHEGQFCIQVEAVSFGRDQSLSIYTHIQMVANDVGTRRWRLFCSEDLSWMFPQLPILAMKEFHETAPLKLSLAAGAPELSTFGIGDPNTVAYEVSVRCRWLGTDDGKNKIFPFSQIFEYLWKDIQQERRNIRPHEQAAMLRVLATPIQ